MEETRAARFLERGAVARLAVERLMV